MPGLQLLLLRLDAQLRLLPGGLQPVPADLPAGGVIAQRLQHAVFIGDLELHQAVFFRRLFSEAFAV